MASNYTVKKYHMYHTDHTDDTFIVLSTVYQQFLSLRTILAVSVDVSTTKFIFASYFSRPISLKNLRNLLIRFRRFIFYSATISYNFATHLGSKIVMYSIYVIMYVHGNQLLQTTDKDDNGQHTLNLFYYLILFLFPTKLNRCKTDDIMRK